LVGAEICLVEGDTCGIGGGFQLLQSGGNVCVRIASCFQVVAQQSGFNGTVVRAIVPVTQVTIAQAVRAALVGKESDDTVLGRSFWARLCWHGLSL
jgi:hypothetical protein